MEQENQGIILKYCDIVDEFIKIRAITDIPYLGKRPSNKEEYKQAVLSLCLDKEEVAKIYENVLRGKKFRVAYFLEKDCIFVRVYLENLPENQLVFIDDKEKQSAIGRTPSIRSLFNTLFVYNPDEKTLGRRI